MNTASGIDVLGLGAVSVDHVGTLAGWPREGGRMLIETFSLHDGGLVGTALVAAARLGGRAAWTGKLGRSPMAGRAIEALEKEGIDTSLVVRDKDSEPVLAFIFTNSTDGQRTILWTRTGVRYPRQSELPDDRWPERTRVFLFDGESGRAGVEAAQVARSHGIPVVVDIVQRDDHVGDALAASSHIILSERFAGLQTGKTELPDMLRGLQTDPGQTVIITRGEKGCVGLSAGRQFELPAYPVDAVDTTGCGDTFHGAFALGLARGMPEIEAARFASAAGALCATKLGGREGLPTLRELEEFVARQG